MTWETFDFAKMKLRLFWLKKKKNVWADEDDREQRTFTNNIVRISWVDASKNKKQYKTV